MLRWIALAAAASLSQPGCGGKTELESELPEQQGAAASGHTGGRASVTDPTGRGGATVVPRGGTSTGGTVGRTGHAGTDVQGGAFFSGGVGGRATGSRFPFAGGGTGGFGGAIGLGGYVVAGGSSRVPNCPDELTYEPAFDYVGRSLRDFADRYQPSCGAAALSPDFSAAFYAAEPGTYVATTLGSSVDTILAAYDGLCGKSELACNDDDAYGSSRQSRVVLEVSRPGFITFVVDSYKSGSGPFQFNVERATALVDATLPSNPPFTVSGSTNGHRDSSTSTCNGKTSSGDYTALFRAPKSGTYQFVVTSPEFDPVLTLREDGPAGRELACNDDDTGTDASVTYALAAGDTVALVVDGFSGGTGLFQLSTMVSADDSGACCTAGTTRVGCIEPDVTSCVCASRPSCCRSLWSSSCAEAVARLGCGICLQY